MSPATKPSTVVAYCRVSTEHQRDGASLPAQRDAVAAWCEAHGYELAGVFEDVASGSSPVSKRPGLMAALGAVVEHRASKLVVVKLDRAFRSLMGQMGLVATLERSGANLVSLAGEGTEGSDPTAVLLRNVMGSFSEFEREVGKQRTATAMAQLRKQGRWPSRAPFGFEVVGGFLQPDQNWAKVVEAFELRSQGARWAVVCDKLDGMSRQGARKLLDRYGDLDGFLAFSRQNATRTGVLPVELRKLVEAGC
jgi:DNA invertase Pin-like site-specific DNA recombinase